MDIKIRGQHKGDKILRLGYRFLYIAGDIKAKSTAILKTQKSPTKKETSKAEPLF